MKAILLVPAPKHGEALVREGPCGTAPPRACEEVRGSWVPFHAGTSPAFFLADSLALVLAWDGALVPEGMHRAASVLAASFDDTTRYGVRWRPCVTPDMWALQADRYAESGTYETFGPKGWHEVPTLASSPVPVGDLRLAWALAVVCEARGLGRMEVLP